jgi:predicted TIM-barrel fold metal-dependent hydrolase
MGVSKGSGQIVISTDGHAGADLQGYKPYLEERYHEEFDAWAATYVDPWGELTGPSRDDQGHGFEQSIGHVAFDIPINWESKRRHELMHHLGITAEVLFPNTAPPFIPSGAISAPPPQTPSEYEYRFAGIRAHNRWMADFCQDAAGQRAGFVQIFLNDLDAAVAEVRWAKEAGLMGVLLPADHQLGLQNLYTPELDPLWAACEESGLPVIRHQVLPAMSPKRGGVSAFWIGIIEVPFFASRSIAHMLCSGVFERFPNLKFVLTELTDAPKVTEILTGLDFMYVQGLSGLDSHGGGGTLGTELISAAVAQLKRKPSEYFATNCYIAGPLDPAGSIAAGVPNVTWGSDIPHAEGCGKYAREAVRVVCDGLDDDTVDDLLYKRAVEVYRFDVDYLQGVADTLGFTRAEARTPLPSAEWPAFPTESHCSLFAARDGNRMMVGR